MEAACFTGPYVRRVVDDELDARFPHLPAILLDGPKGVGKTATALRSCATVRRLDGAADRSVIATESGSSSAVSANYLRVILICY